MTRKSVPQDHHATFENLRHLGADGNEYCLTKTALPIFAKPSRLNPMSTMNISLPESLKTFVDTQISEQGYGSNSEYIRELIRKEQDRSLLRQLLLDGGASPQGQPANADWFDGLRQQIRSKHSTP